MKKTIISIMTLCLVVSLMTPEVALAQDDVYLTPSQAKVFRAKLSQEREKRIQEIKERQEARQKRRAQYAEDVDDWYNRRQMRVTVAEMEQNLSRLEGDSVSESSRQHRYGKSATHAKQGGKYSQRLKRFSNDQDVIVLENVDRVYLLDDMDYDPWTNSYYGRDWKNGVNISINVGPYYPYQRYSWGYSPYAWGYRYDPWFDDPWYYDSWYRGSWYWGHPRYYGWRYTSPWHGGYHSGYWDGYYDAHYDYGYHTPIYSSSRFYSSYGRAVGTEYDRSAHNEIYGRALGNSTRSITYSDTYDRTAMRSGDYDNAVTRHRATYQRSSTRNEGSSTWDRGRTYEHRGSSVHSSSTRSSGSYGGSVSSGSGSSTRGTGATGRSTSASRRGR